MKIALITTPTRTYAPNTVLPLGVMYLASYLKENGHGTMIIDVAKTRQENQATISELRRFGPDLIGISGIITSYAFVKTLVRDLKKALPGIPVVIGGHITIDNTESLMRQNGCDYTVTGYGEKALLYLVEYLDGKRALSDIPGLSYRKGDQIVSNPGTALFGNIDELPLPDYDSVDMEYYITVAGVNPKLEMYLRRTGKTAPAPRSAFVVGARGCTDKCSFCVHEFEYKGFYVHSTDYVTKNIGLLYEKFGIRIFGMGEDLFLYNPGQAKSFAEAMNKNFPDAYFSCSIRADFVTPELLKALKDSNCAYLAYGFESGSDAMLRILGKRMTRQTNIRAYQLISQTDIYPGCSFMVGTPGETDKTIQETVEAIREAGITESAVFFTTPYPGSRLFKWCTERGLVTDVDGYLETVSNRDAMVLTINLTKYPDIIVKLMRMMVLRALDKNLLRAGKASKLSPHKFVMIHIVAPFAYETYFMLRKICGLFLARFRNESTGIALNDEGTILLSTDRQGI